MLARSDWLAYHQQHSANKLVVFYGSPKKETHGYDVLFCVRPKPREIFAVGKIQKQNVISPNEAWTKYGSALGAQSEKEWRQQADSVLKNSLEKYKGNILAIELSDFRLFPEPINLESVGIGNTDWQLMKEVSEEETNRLMDKLQTDSDPDFILAQEFGLEPDEITFKEGKERMRLHLTKERNRQLVNRAKESWYQSSNGKLHCEVCNFSFPEKYGKVGAGFIEAHHRISIASLTAETIVKIADLAAVCSNCHRMIHRHQPLLTIQELKQIIQKP